MPTRQRQGGARRDMRERLLSSDSVVLALPLTLAASAATFLAFLVLSTSRSIKISCLAWDAHERGRRGRRTEPGREGG